MITTKQKWILGGLVTLSASVWTPQLLERVNASTSAQVSVASGPDEAEMLQIEMSTSGTGSTHPGAPLTLTVGSNPSASNTAASSGTIRPGGSTALVSEVLQTLRSTDAFGATAFGGSAASTARPAADAGEVVAPELDEEPAAQPALLVFIEENPLRGTIVGETVSVALIGKHRVRLGETVPGTGAVVSHIERGRATLDDGSLSVELELQPLETDAALMEARAARGSASVNTAGPDSDQPAAAPQPTPATTPEPAGSQGDF